MYNYIYKLIVCLTLSCSSLFAIVDAYNEGEIKFSWNLMQALGEPKGNVCFSPYNISSALQLAYFGAEKTTKSEISYTLHIPLMAEEALVGRITAADEALSKNVSNARAIAVDSSFMPARDYLSIVRDSLKATVFEVDFLRKSREAVESINSWASEKTHGHISKLLEATDIKPSTRLVLLSAIYLKAAWQTPFRTENTQEASFKMLDASEAMVPMMQQKEMMSLYQDKEVQVVFRRMSREEHGPDLEACIVLPRETVQLQDVYRGLSLEQFSKWEEAAKSEQVELYLPKCSLRQRISLKKPLQSMGMRQPFSNAANFTKLSPGLELAIDDVLHEAYMQLDEAGIEAAAATAVVMKMTAVMPQAKNPVVVRCDRPFFVIVRERTSGLVLFVSLVANPQKIVKN